jgi:hypothetical protein
MLYGRHDMVFVLSDDGIAELHSEVAPGAVGYQRMLLTRNSSNAPYSPFLAEKLELSPHMDSPRKTQLVFSLLSFFLPRLFSQL